MTISFHQIDVKYRLKNKRILREWIHDAIRREKLVPGAITIVFCSDNHLLDVNQRFLQHDYYTDIITFDYSQENSISGDLFISIDRVKENAQENEVSQENEIQRVIIHGVMHLCGYKDKKKSDQILMRKMEDFYLKKLQNKLK
ncbi:MAG: rRNA maturation RNase YbeY [Flavobacteriales bacterium]|nr:rRNA maturation RNase YbeY [Flavobacteriales bacterium]